MKKEKLGQMEAQQMLLESASEIEKVLEPVNRALSALGRRKSIVGEGIISSLRGAKNRLTRIGRAQIQ